MGSNTCRAKQLNHSTHIPSAYTANATNAAKMLNRISIAFRYVRRSYKQAIYIQWSSWIAFHPSRIRKFNTKKQYYTAVSNIKQRNNKRSQHQQNKREKNHNNHHRRVTATQCNLFSVNSAKKLIYSCLLCIFPIFRTIENIRSKYFANSCRRMLRSFELVLLSSIAFLVLELVFRFRASLNKNKIVRRSSAKINIFVIKPNDCSSPWFFSR